MWAGADARSLGPSFEDGCTDDPECYTTALQQACYSGNLEVIKKLKPEPHPTTSLIYFTVRLFCNEPM